MTNHTLTATDSPGARSQAGRPFHCDIVTVSDAHRDLVDDDGRPLPGCFLELDGLLVEAIELQGMDAYLLSLEGHWHEAHAGTWLDATIFHDELAQAQEGAQP